MKNTNKWKNNSLWIVQLHLAATVDKRNEANMIHSREDIKYCEHLLNSFYGIGVTSEGGVTRLGYTAVEDAMHKMFEKLGEEIDCESIQDQVGNTYVCNNMEDDYYLIGSHLDSVVDGGRYDGVAGVIAGLMVLKWAKEDGIEAPIRVGGFRCEESSNFGCCTVGSGLITKEASKQEIGGMIGKDGRSIAEVFAQYGYSLNPDKITGIKQYLEVHIEQGKVLQEYNTQIGVVKTIAGPRRFYLHIHGLAEHSGTTPMTRRNDALCAAAEVILEVERIGKQESYLNSVATVGVVENMPNALNVVPGHVMLGVDMRGVGEESLARMEQQLKDNTKLICANRQVELKIEKLNAIPPIHMGKELQVKLANAAREIGLTANSMISGAGHDAMSFADICETGLVFIPCIKGISHNKMEFTSIENICNGARVLYEHIRRECNDIN